VPAPAAARTSPCERPSLPTQARASARRRPPDAPPPPPRATDELHPPRGPPTPLGQATGLASRLIARNHA
jgi:hypothetical protein